MAVSSMPSPGVRVCCVAFRPRAWAVGVCLKETSGQHRTACTTKSGDVVGDWGHGKTVLCASAHPCHEIERPDADDVC